MRHSGGDDVVIGRGQVQNVDQHGAGVVLRTGGKRGRGDAAGVGFGIAPRRQQRRDLAIVKRAVNPVADQKQPVVDGKLDARMIEADQRSEEHTSALPSLMSITYAVLCLKKTKQNHNYTTTI